MSHCVVVWEWRSGGAGGARWMPHGPGVARQLEHALAKGLTRVVLADVEPSLRGHYVNLRTLTQCTDGTEGIEDGAERRVRRACYSAQSPAGRGVRWEWARLAAPPHRAELVYELLPMEVQCRLEEAWARGADTLSLEEWVVQLACMTARGCGGVVRLLRRAAQLPYPRARSPAPPPPALPIPPAPPAPARRPHPLPPHHSQEQMIKQCEETVLECEGRRTGCDSSGAGGARGHDRKPGFKHLLHNLNIFSHNRAANVHVESPTLAPVVAAPAAAVAEETRLDYDSSSTRSGRRHSVDTISTYLSHESKESLRQPPVADLLDCSGSSDEVFATDAPVRSDESVSTRCAEEPAAWVRRVECVQWGAVCPLCVRALDARPAAEGGVVALVDCQHMMHLHCLNEQLDRQRVRQEPLYVECGVCGRIYGTRRMVRGGEGGEDNAGGGEQPAGSMAWCVQPRALPGYPPHTASIVVTYNFASGVQCAAARHPAPGCPYYAVGFPRRSVLPDTGLGRTVFGALRRAWERRRLFTVAASQTTGREHVVAWSVPPPPADRAQYAVAAAAGDVDAPLRACLARLERLAPIVQPARPHIHSPTHSRLSQDEAGASSKDYSELIVTMVLADPVVYSFLLSSFHYLLGWAEAVRGRLTSADARCFVPSVQSGDVLV
ncbi:Protein deltex [Eumeta japonica]|uniref:E3 ubiquitin-protein ligase n=1 Tax=Eumeta variegata TaxID=151549 RepID=A0A4C2AD33_EUMVA|nr:Protein deltex [Eumeta japonica]